MGWLSVIGKTISHYKILEKLGEGGMGVVYKAQDTRLDRFVAIKFLPSHLSADKEATKRFIYEAKAASALDHQHICTIYEIDETKDGQTFIVMAYYEGETLRERIDQGSITVDEAMDITAQVASGLAKAHDKGIVHRDVKPSNILITSDGEAKIIDFGLAKLAGKTRITKKGSTLGTAAYMSPELALGEEVDHRSDIFSLGIIFYELLTGKLPFKGEHEAALIYEIVHEEPMPLSRYRDDIPLQLQDIIDKSLQKDINNRYPYVTDMVRDLKSIQSGTVWEEPVRRSKGGALKRKPVIVGISILVLIIGFIILSPYILIGPDKVEAKRIMLAILPFENLGPAEDEYFADGITEEITARLASVRGLGVIARTSAIRYKNTDKTIEQIGEELGVEYILEGTIRWQHISEGQSQVRITPQLIKVSDATHLWAEPYQEDPSDIFQVQISIANRVVDALNVTLLSSEQRLMKSIPTENFEAYTFYLHGQSSLNRGTDQTDLQEAQQWYEKAIELDPTFTSSYAQLSSVHSLLYHFYFDRSQERIVKAKEAADMAVKLEPDLPAAHIALGTYYYYCHRDYDRALEELAIAEKGLPNDCDILFYIGAIRRRQGKWAEGLENLKSASELDPHRIVLLYQIALTYRWLRNYSEADRYVDRSISLDPKNSTHYAVKVNNYLCWKGNTEQAREVLQKAKGYGDEEKILDELLLVDIFDGEYDKALKRLSAVRSESIYDGVSFIPTAEYVALVYELKGQVQMAQVYYDSARVLLEGKIKVSPKDSRFHSALGIAYAGLDRKEEAIEEGKLAVELLPISKDALNGYRRLRDLAIIYTMVDEYDVAIDQLDYLLSIPGTLSVGLLRLDPRWNPLRDHPRFQELLEKYSGEVN